MLRFDLSVQATFYVQSAFVPRLLPGSEAPFFFFGLPLKNPPCIHNKGLGISQKYFYGNFKEITAVKIVSVATLALLAILLKRKFFPSI